MDKASLKRLRVAHSFARALDKDRFGAVAAVLEHDCRYQSPEGVIGGRSAIAASYQEHSTRARAEFDEIVYESEVGDADGDEIPIVFIDRIRKGALEHTYRCRQWIRVTVAGTIESIRHEELAGEREALRLFRAALSQK